MTRVLYVSAFMPDATAGHAGGQAAHDNLRRLRADAEVDVFVCTTEPLAASLTGATVLRQTPRDLFRAMAGALGSLPLRSVVMAPWIHTRMNEQAQRHLQQRFACTSYASVFVDFTQALQLTLGALPSPSPPVTVCVHDVYAQLALRSRRAGFGLMGGLLMREEHRLLSQAGTVITLNAKDADLVRSLYALPRVEVKPFSPPTWTGSVTRSAASIDPQRLLFFGNFDRRENADAARWFVAHALPVLRRELPGAYLVLAGTGSDRLAATLAQPHVVKGTGFLADPSAEFQRCALSIAPLSEGAGVKFKVLEALACGVPVVGTAVAAEGIPPAAGLTLASLDDFATTVLSSLKR
jgi:hypothetical protein